MSHLIAVQRVHAALVVYHKVDHVLERWIGSPDQWPNHPLNWSEGKITKTHNGSSDGVGEETRQFTISYNIHAGGEDPYDQVDPNNVTNGYYLTFALYTEDQGKFLHCPIKASLAKPFVISLEPGKSAEAQVQCDWKLKNNTPLYLLMGLMGVVSLLTLGALAVGAVRRRGSG